MNRSGLKLVKKTVKGGRTRGYWVKAEAPKTPRSPPKTSSFLKKHGLVYFGAQFATGVAMSVASRAARQVTHKALGGMHGAHPTAVRIAGHGAGAAAATGAWAQMWKLTNKNKRIREASRSMFRRNEDSAKHIFVAGLGASAAGHAVGTYAQNRLFGKVG